MASKTPLNQASPMNHALIPQKNNRAFKMTQKVVQKSLNLRCFDVFTGIESDIQGGALSFRRNADSGNSRYFRPIARHRQMGSLSPRRPCAPDIGNQEKTAFVKKYQMGTSLIRVFLYAAIRSVSSVVWLFRRVLGLSFRVSGSSSPSRLEDARGDWGDTSHQTVFLLPRQRALWSIDRCGIPSRTPLSVRFASRFFSGRPSVFAGVRVPILLSWLLRLLSGTFRATETPSPVNNRVSSLRPTGYNRFAATLWRVGAAFRVAFGFHMVSCI